MRFNDAIIGGVIIAFALAMMLYTLTFPTMPGQAYGPDLFPLVIGAGMVLCGLALVVRGLRAGDALMALGPWAEDRSHLINLALVPGVLLFYVGLSDFLGFVITSVIVLTVLLLRFGVARRTTFIIAPVTTLFIHTVFAKLLLVPLPWGLLLPIAW